MKGGPSIEVLLDLALGNDVTIAKRLQRFLKLNFLYEADTARLEAAFKSGNEIAKEILESYAANFLQTPEVVEEIKVVTYIAGEGDISTDLLSPSTQDQIRTSW
jgi:aconitate hydratase 2/2-methylisocitrate dehydratase